MPDSCPCHCSEACNLTAPTVWTRVGTGYRIETLQKQDFHLAVTLIQQYFFINDVLFNALGFKNDSQSIASFISHLFEIMSTGSSLLLIDNKDDTVVGVLLLSVVNKMNFGRTFSHSTMQHGDVYEQYIALQNFLHRHVDFFLDYETRNLLRFYLLCIANEHRGKRLGYHMFRAAIEIARHMHIPIASGLWTSEESQLFVKHFGFDVVYSVKYEDWFKETTNEWFEAPDPRHSIALMVSRVTSFYVTPIQYGGSATKRASNVKQKKDKKKINFAK